MNDETLNNELNEESTETEVEEESEEVTLPSYNNTLLKSEERTDLETLYSTFSDTIYAIYLTGAACIKGLRFTINKVDIMIILNDAFDTENNKLVSLYINNYLVEHLDTRFNFITRYLNDPIKPLFHIEGQQFELSSEAYTYHFMNLLDPIAGQKINFNIDLITLVNQDYVLYLFEDLISTKRAISLSDGKLGYTNFLYPIILTTYFILNNEYHLNATQGGRVDRAYLNDLSIESYNEFKEDFLKLLKKFDIDF